MAVPGLSNDGMFIVAPQPGGSNVRSPYGLQQETADRVLMGRLTETEKRYV